MKIELIWYLPLNSEVLIKSTLALEFSLQLFSPHFLYGSFLVGRGVDLIAHFFTN